MIKVRLKRVKHGSYSYGYTLDEHFVSGSVTEMPKKGKPVIFHFDKLGNGDGPVWWTTTEVVSVIRGKRLTIFNTKNSWYHIKKG